MHDSFKWESFANTIVVNLVRFKVTDFNGEHASWQKDTRAILCPHMLQIQDNIYVLVAAVGHSGSNMLGGHYTAMVRNATNRVWYMCNDRTVKECQPQPPRGGTFSRLHDKSHPCLLFYQKHTLVETFEESNVVRPSNGDVKTDSPDTQAVKQCMNTTPKRRQSFPPNMCKMCGQRVCDGSCVQCL